MKKITRATFKGFVKRNRESLYVKVKSNFDAMVDGVRPVNGGFEPAQEPWNEVMREDSLGIRGVWLVGNSRDYFTPYEDDIFTGISCCNCCGSWIVAIQK